MIFAEKIIRERKKNGWSQEELAEKMSVSRQAVGKWESSQSVPDLDKILQLASLFGVTTDYLLKDEMESEEYAESTEASAVRRVTLGEANDYLESRVRAAKRIALGVFLCIFSPIPLILLGAMSEYGIFSVTENWAGGLGMVLLFLFVVPAVMLFIRTGFENAPYEFFENEPFETEYGVSGMVKEKQKAYRDTYMRYNYIGACLCVMSPVPLLVGAFTEKEFFVVLMLALTMITAGIGVMFFILAGVRWASMQRLLCEGEFSKKKKEKNKILELIASVYWLVATAVYLGWSFLSNDWEITWVIWPIAGVLFAAMELIFDFMEKKKE